MTGKNLLIIIFIFLSSWGLTQVDLDSISNKIDLAVNQMHNGQLDQSLSLLFNCLDDLEAIEKKNPDIYTELANTCVFISQNYYNSNTELSSEFALKAIKYSKGSQNNQIELIACTVYLQSIDENQFCEAKNQRINDTLLHLAKKLHESIFIVDGLVNKYKCTNNSIPSLVLENRIDSTLLLIEDSLVKNPSDDLSKTLISSISNFGLTLYEKGKYDKAKQKFLRSFQLLKESHSLEYYLTVTKNLYETCNKLEQFEESNKYLLLFNDSLEGIYANMLEQKFTEAHAKYEDLKKNKQLISQQLDLTKTKLNLHQERTYYTNTIIISVFVLTILLILILIIINKQNEKKKKLREEYDQQKQINAQKTSFIETVAHEIRTPMTLAKGYLDLAISQNNMEQAQLAKNSIERIISDSQSILNYLKNEDLKPERLNEEIETEAFFKRVFFAFESAAIQKDIELVFSSSLNSNRIFSNKERLERITNNIISNSLKYSDRKTKIQLNISQITNELKITLSDQGIGINEHDREKVFDKFYQANSRTNSGGIGLGLSIVKSHLDEMNGTIKIKTNSPNGTIFKISIPVEVVDETSKKTATVDNNANTIGQPKILLVEDNLEMGEYIRLILSGEHECHQVYNGVEALEKIQSNSYDLIISDIMMEKMDGVELKKKLNKLDNFSHIPFIFLTAKSSESAKLEALELGAADFMLKPFDAAEIKSRVRNILFFKSKRDLWAIKNKELVLDSLNDSQKLMNSLKSVILKKLHDEEFNVKSLAEELGYSTKHIGRIIKTHTGMTAVQYILENRLQKAYQFLITRKFETLSEVKYNVGILSTTYFNRKFNERFGILPKELLDKTTN